MHYTAMQQQPDVLYSPSPSSLLVDFCLAVFFPSPYSLICCRFLSRALSLSLGMDSQAFQEHVLTVFASLVERVSLSWVSFSCLFPSTGESILFLQRKLGMAPNVKPVSFLGSTILLSFHHCLWARVTQQLQPVLQLFE